MPSTWNTSRSSRARACTRAVDLGDAAARELEHGIGRVLGIGHIAGASLVEALRDVIGAQAEHALHRAEQVVQHIAPVAQHIEDDAAALFLL